MLKKSILITRKYMSGRSRRYSLRRHMLSTLIYVGFLMTGVFIAPKADQTFTHIISVVFASIGVQGLFLQMLRKR